MLYKLSLCNIRIALNRTFPTIIWLKLGIDKNFRNIYEMAAVRIIGKSQRVVDAPGLTIDELAG